ncbi:MAG: noncanonical pyrimidine nucleotidase, YjjG family [Clostridiales bacterium]|nr:noncanonical pyrimidine nucleotidase, YjjG family [Clostridiales bacterium]
MAKFDLMLFDADNTLFDFDRAEAVALEKVFEQYGFEYNLSILEKYKKINSFLWKEFEHARISKEILQVRRFSEILKVCGLQADAATLNNDYLVFLGQGGYLNEGALELCSTLSTTCTVAIVTNGISTTQKNRLKCSAIAPYIKHIIVSEDAGYQKPHQGFFKYAFDVCGWREADKKKVMIVGDSLNADIKGGADFGITTCWYNPNGEKGTGKKKAHYTIGNLSELWKIIADDA